MDFNESRKRLQGEQDEIVQCYNLSIDSRSFINRNIQTGNRYRFTVAVSIAVLE